MNGDGKYHIDLNISWILFFFSCYNLFILPNVLNIFSLKFILLKESLLEFIRFLL